ncbi:MAG: hypothetical protein KAY37_13395, partial [Phycisphaerae bacterium]|nr:hypothetical protein [Phycisphaerae bacterium]
MPKRERIRFREGPKAFEAKCVRKIKRAYDMDAGGWWCLDGRVLDIMCRVPDDRREWRRDHTTKDGRPTPWKKVRDLRGLAAKYMERKHSAVSNQRSAESRADSDRMS